FTFLIFSIMYSNSLELNDVVFETRLESPIIDYFQNRPESPVPMFELYNQPNVQQRKSYKKENRLFLFFLFFIDCPRLLTPTPIIRLVSESDKEKKKIHYGHVFVSLGIRVTDVFSLTLLKVDID